MQIRSYLRAGIKPSWRIKLAHYVTAIASKIGNTSIFIISCQDCGKGMMHAVKYAKHITYVRYRCGSCNREAYEKIIGLKHKPKFRKKR